MKYIIAILLFTPFFSSCQKMPLTPADKGFNAVRISSNVFDAMGETVYFDSLVKNITIKNAVLDGNGYKQIFDTTVTLINCKAREFNSAWVVPSGVNDASVYLQKCIDICVSNGIKNLFIADNYTYSNSLKVYNLYKGSYVGVGLDIYGDGDMFDAKTVLTYTGNSFAIGFQMAKGGSISKLKIQGNYTPSQSTGVAYYNTAFPIGSNKGIVIDYDGTKNQGGSTGFKIEDMWVDGFDVLYDVSPNGITYNADALSFRNIRCGNGRVGVRSNQAQEKGNEINNIVSWGKIETLISIGNSGKYQAGQYIVRNGNIAGGCVQLFNVTLAGWNSFTVQGLYAESIARIGFINASTSTISMAVALNQMNIRFAYKSMAGNQNLLTANSVKIKLSDCNLWYYGASNETMNFNGAMTFSNCDFGPNIMVNPNAIVIK